MTTLGIVLIFIGASMFSYAVWQGKQEDTTGGDTIGLARLKLLGGFLAIAGVLVVIP